MTRRRCMGVLLAWTLSAVSACFSIRDFDSGVLRCDDGKCPPGLECRSDNRCYRPGDGVKDAAGDAPLVLADAPPVDARATDASRDAPISMFDAGACPVGAERCQGNVRQTCPTGAMWTEGETCSAFGCYDLDGPSGPQSYCGECQNGDKRCSGGLQTCVDGRFSTAVDCSVTAGWSCFDPAPAGGTDAYCGLCLKNSMQCRGDNLDMCNAQGTDFTTTSACTWGCNPATLSCCAEPDCSVICGESSANACGKTRSCGDCGGGTCCPSGTKCCGATQTCCGNICCNGPPTCCL